MNQYAVERRRARLRQAIAEHAQRFYGQAVDPDTMVTVTSGATEAIFATLLGLVDPGDEVILFEPVLRLLRGRRAAWPAPSARYVPLRPPDAAHAAWWFDAGGAARGLQRRAPGCSSSTRRTTPPARSSPARSSS